MEQTLSVHIQATGDDQLWVSDGTVGGTRQVAPSIRFGSLDDFTSYSGALYFTARGIGVGSGLWRSDGTSAGTVLAIRDGTNSNSSHDIAGSIDSIRVAGGKLYLVGIIATAPGVGIFQSDGSQSIWVSDGSATGTTLLTTILPADPSQFFKQVTANSNFAVLGGRVFFLVQDFSVFKARLWSTDNTAGGTHPVATMSLTGNRIIVSGNVLYFAALGDETGKFTGFELWESDGTNDVGTEPDGDARGTHLVHDINPGILDGVVGVKGDGSGLPDLRGIDFNGVLLFAADDGFHGGELWKVDCPKVNADLELVQIAEPSSAIVVGEAVTYTLSVVNHGPDAAETTLVDTLPDSATIVGVGTSRGSFTQNGNSITFHLGNLITSGQATVTIRVIANAPGDFVNSARVFSVVNDPVPANNSTRTTVLVTQDAVVDLSVEATGTPLVTHAGKPVSLTFRVSNQGPHAATGAVLTVRLPGSYTLSNAPGLKPASSADNTLYFSLPVLARGETTSVTLEVTPRAAGIFIATASAAASERDANSEDNSAQVRSIVTADELLSTTTSTTHATVTTRNNLPNVQEYRTQVVAVLTNGSRIVFDMAANSAPNSTQIKELFNQAIAALKQAGAAQITSPELSSSSTQTGPATLIEELALPPGVSVTVTRSEGPTTILIGKDQAESKFIASGVVNYNTNTASEVRYQQNFQATATNFATYIIRGSPFQGGLPKTYSVTGNTTTRISAATGLLNQPKPAGRTLRLVPGSVSTLPVGFALSVATDGSFIVTPKLNFVGQVSFTYKLNDGANTSEPISVTLIVLPEPPLTGRPKVYAVAGNTTTRITAASGLLDQPKPPGAILRLAVGSVSNLPPGFKLRIFRDGSFTVTPKPGFFGEIKFTYALSDGRRTSMPIVVTLLVQRRGRQWNR